jgi:hypothetical protein
MISYVMTSTDSHILERRIATSNPFSHSNVLDSPFVIPFVRPLARCTHALLHRSLNVTDCGFVFVSVIHYTRKRLRLDESGPPPLVQYRSHSDYDIILLLDRG